MSISIYVCVYVRAYVYVYILTYLDTCKHNINTYTYEIIRVDCFENLDQVSAISQNPWFVTQENRREHK